MADHQCVLNQHNRLPAEKQDLIGIQHEIEVSWNRRLRRDCAADVPEDQPDEIEPPIGGKSSKIARYEDRSSDDRDRHEFDSQTHIEDIRNRHHRREIRAQNEKLSAGRSA
jgi:hypothetical protein